MHRHLKKWRHCHGADEGEEVWPRQGSCRRRGSKLRKAVFLAEMETVVPWAHFEALIEPHYPKKGNGRPPMPLSTMLRIHFMQ